MSAHWDEPTYTSTSATVSGSISIVSKWTVLRKRGSDGDSSLIVVNLATAIAIEPEGDGSRIYVPHPSHCIEVIENVAEVFEKAAIAVAG